MTTIKVLLLQDCTSYMYPINKVIEESGCEVLHVLASASDELLRNVFILQPDLIICDDSQRKLIMNTEQRIKKNIPIVFIGLTETCLAAKPMPNRSTAYLMWPFTADVLRAMIRLLL